MLVFKLTVLAWFLGSVKSFDLYSMKEDELCTFVEDGLKAVQHICDMVATTFQWQINTTFDPDLMHLLFFEHGGYTSYRLPEAADQIFKRIDFDASARTYVYAHGFIDITGHNSDNVHKMARAIRSQGYNFISLDSRVYQMNLFYLYVAAYAGHMGEALFDFMSRMHLKGVSPSSWYLLGHSLGAQIMGEAARRYRQAFGSKVARITGLDPTAVCFSAEESLRSDDADYVDFIYTSVLTFRNRSLAHAHYYVGGWFNRKLPGCEGHLIVETECTHMRAISLYAESARHNTAFLAKKCVDIKNYVCDSSVTSYMGFASDNRTRGDYLLNINRQYPFGMRNLGI